MVNAKQISCTGQFGELLYPDEYRCMKCKTRYIGKSLAEYCCSNKLGDNTK